MNQASDRMPGATWREAKFAIGLPLAAGLLMVGSYSAYAESVGRQNFLPWKIPSAAQADRRSQTSAVQSGRGFFGSLFSFGRGRRLSQDEIRSRLSESPTRKPAFFVYKPEPWVPLHNAKLDADVEHGTLAFHVHQLLKSGGAAPLRAQAADANAVRAFYKENNFAPIWISAADFNSRASNLLKLFSRSDEEGLEPSVYLPGTLSGFKDKPSNLTREGLARLELELTISALIYARHASAGRLVPNKIGRNFDIKTTPFAPSTALARLASSEDVTSVLRGLHPSHVAYRAMKEELGRLRATLATAEEQVVVPFERTLRAGMNRESVQLLRARLAQLGFGVEASEQGHDEIVDPLSDRFDRARVSTAKSRSAGRFTRFDDNLVESVKAFQGSRGLKQDGLAGRRTIAALNARPASPEEKIQKLKISMERMRWLPRALGDRHILVNKPEYVARVIDFGRITHSMRVVVGKPRFPTTEFYDQMEHVVFNPYWNVPRSIAGNEMLPRLWSDPGYLDRAGYQVLDRRGRRVSSYSVDWSSYTRSTLPYSVRQPPGRGNALGAIKFMFPNKHAIYMHDTPAKNLFQRVTRAYSHGCVRVQTPRKFAEIVLGWDRSQVDAAIGSGQNRQVDLGKDIPVYLTYFTAWPDDSGRIRYHKDVYGRDAAMLKALKTLNGTEAQS